MAHPVELQAKLHRSLDDIIKDKSKRPAGNEPKAVRNPVQGFTQTRGVQKKQGSQSQHRDAVKGLPGAGQGKKPKAQPAVNRAQHKQQPKQHHKQRQQPRQSGNFTRSDFDSMGIEQLQQVQQQRQQLEAYEQQLRQRLMQEQGMYGPDQPGFDSNDSGAMQYTAMDDAENIYIDGMAFGSEFAGEHNHHRPQAMYRQYMEDNDDGGFGFANQSNSLYPQDGQGNIYQQHHFHDGTGDDHQGYYDDYANYDDSYDNYDSHELNIRNNYRQHDTGYERPTGDMMGDTGRGRRGHYSPQPRSRSRSRGRSLPRHRSRSPLPQHVQRRSVSPMYRHEQQHVRKLDNGSYQQKQQASQGAMLKGQPQGKRGKQQALAGTTPNNNAQQQQQHRMPAHTVGQTQAKQGLFNINTSAVKRQAQGTLGSKHVESPRQRQAINSPAVRPAVSPGPSNAVGTNKSKRTRIEFNLPPKPSAPQTTTVSNGNQQLPTASNMRATAAAGGQTNKGAAGLPDVSGKTNKEAGRPMNVAAPKSPGRTRMLEQHPAHGVPKSPARRINHNTHDDDDEYDPDVEELSPRYPRQQNHIAAQPDIKQEADEPRLIAPPTVYRNATIAGGEVGFLKTVMHPSAGIDEEPVSMDDVAITIVAINHTLTIQCKKSYVLSFNQMMRVKQSMEMGMRFALINDNALLEGSGAGTVVRLPRAVIKSSEEMTDLTELGRQMLASQPEVPGQPAPPVRSAFAFIQHQLVNQTDWAEIIAMYPDLYTLNAQDAAAVVFAYAELQRRKQTEQQQQQTAQQQSETQQ